MFEVEAPTFVVSVTVVMIDKTTVPGYHPNSEAECWRQYGCLTAHILPAAIFLFSGFDKLAGRAGRGN